MALRDVGWLFFELCFGRPRQASMECEEAFIANPSFASHGEFRPWSPDEKHRPAALVFWADLTPVFTNVEVLHLLVGRVGNIGLVRFARGFQPAGRVDGITPDVVGDPFVADDTGNEA